MKKNVPLTAEILRQVFDYNPQTGVFLHKAIRQGAKHGCKAGYVAAYDGYMRVSVLGKSYKGHRLAWLYVYGTWPSLPLDHIDGNSFKQRNQQSARS